MQTLHYFLSDKGISEFQNWYLGKESLKSIWKNLDNYVLKLLSIQFKENANIESAQIKRLIREYLDSYIQNKYNKSANEIFQEWLDTVNKYCFQGGYGYSFLYPDAPHHWVIKPVYYDKVSNIPEEVAIAACVLDKYILISNISAWEKWSN